MSSPARPRAERKGSPLPAITIAPALPMPAGVESMLSPPANPAAARAGRRPAGAATWLCLTESQLSRLRLSVRFIGYTNALWGIRVGIIQVSNASSFAVVRGRSPVVVFDSPATPVNYAPTGLRVLESGESERVMTEPLTNGIRWRLVVVGERLGDDIYGIGREPRLRVWMRAVAFWLQEQGLRVPTPGPPPGREFSSNWVED